MSLDESAVWRALQEVDDGADPADVYARLTSESEDVEEAIENDVAHLIESPCNDITCRAKQESYFCEGVQCVVIEGGRVMLDCPCKCHDGDHG